MFWMLKLFLFYGFFVDLLVDIYNYIFFVVSMIGEVM